MRGDSGDGFAVPANADADPAASGGITRRRMVGYLLAGPTLIAAATWKAAPAAAAPNPTVQAFDAYDLSDLLTQAATPTFALLTVTMNSDGTASFDMPRAEVGQGITTALAMTIADELELPVDKVRMSLADAKPELVWNQFTGGSNTMHAIYEPVRMAAASAKGRMLQVAAEELGVAESDLRVRKGVITAPDGRSLTYGSLAEKAAVDTSIVVSPQLKPRAQQQIVGTGHKRIDARDAVTGKKQFAMDLDVPDALPTMLCRPPSINGRALSVRNASDVRGMPGVTDVEIIPHDQNVQGGVAVRAKTFGQCIDAIRALSVEWAPGPTVGKSEDTILGDLKEAELQLEPPPSGTVLDETFTFMFRPGDPLETNCAVADVRSDGAEIWSCLKSPIWAKEQIATALGLGADQVKVHVTEGGGSFGRHLFCDAAFEAAMTSKELGKPVKLMWHRTDNFRHGRVHPMYTSRVRVVHDGAAVLALDQRHTGVATDFTQGLGELLTAMGAAQPGQNFLQYSQSVFNLTANVPYNFGAVTQLLNEIYEFNTFNTSSVRNVYSPEVATAVELMVDRVAQDLNKDPLEFRKEFAKDDRTRAVLAKVAEVGNWGRSMPAGTAQGISCRNEYKGRSACLIEIDTRPQQTERRIEHAYTGPRVTKAVFAVDVGLPINPLGLEAQMMGGIMDGIGQVLSFGLHHHPDGYFLEGSWDDAFYTRQWNVPQELEIIVMPPTTGEPGGAGEFAVGTSMAATACAYARATGEMPKKFPLNHDGALGFEPFPTQPPIPAAPTDGLAEIRRARKKKKTKKRKTRRSSTRTS